MIDDMELPNSEKQLNPASNDEAPFEGAVGTTVRVITRLSQHHILILNSKGGSGKSTVASNLASYYTTTNRKPALLDYDPQGSSTHWLNLRGNELPEIFGIKAYEKQHSGITRSQHLKTPADVSRLIYDTPGSLDGLELDQLLDKADTILIPVQPSPIDIHAATRFIQKVLLNPHFRRSKKRLAVIANRAKRNTLVYSKLRLFLNRLGIPFIATISDTQAYVKAFENGMGVSELKTKQALSDTESWEGLHEWIENGIRR